MNKRTLKIKTDIKLDKRTLKSKTKTELRNKTYKNEEKKQRSKTKTNRHTIEKINLKQKQVSSRFKNQELKISKLILVRCTYLYISISQYNGNILEDI